MRSALIALLLAGCATTAPRVETIEVVVERFRPLPEWATEPLSKPEAIDGTVGAAIRNEEARGAVIDLANCHRRLLRAIDAGQAVKKDECK